MQHWPEWHSDNGSAYGPANTQVPTFLGIGLLVTPVKSLQSNGMSEAFVKTPKPDYASTAVLPKPTPSRHSGLAAIVDD